MHSVNRHAIVTPDAELYKEAYYPLLNIGCEAVGKGGPCIIEMNQGGAVVGYGLVELIEHASGLEKLGHHELQF